MSRPVPRFKSQGPGTIEPARFAGIGTNVVFEDGALVFHPENVLLGSNIYIGHYAILNGYHRGDLAIGDNTWIGQHCLLHGAGGLRIGRNVGIGAGVRIITSEHVEEGREVPILFGNIATAPVAIEDDCDIGIGSIVLPGVTVGRGSIVGAGAVVTSDLPEYCVAVGVPARVMRTRD